MDATPGFLIWRVRRSPHYVSCVVVQVGEEYFELHIFDGHELVHRESFDSTGPLLRRAEALRRSYTSDAGKESEKAKRELAHS
jgi:hypothetical protein